MDNEKVYYVLTEQDCRESVLSNGPVVTLCHGIYSSVNFAEQKKDEERFNNALDFLLADRDSKSVTLDLEDLDGYVEEIIDTSKSPNTSHHGLKQGIQLSDLEDLCRIYHPQYNKFYTYHISKHKIDGNLPRQ